MASIPRLPFEYQGRAAEEFLAAISFPGGTRRFRLADGRANGQPAFGCYLRDPHAPVAHARGLLVRTPDSDHACAITRFTDGSVLPRFWRLRTLPS